MNFTRIILPFLFLSVVIFLGQSCKPPKPGIYENKQIPSARRGTFDALNKQLFEGLTANSKRILSDIMSKEMIDDHNNLRDIEIISNHIKDGAYTLLDEYYIVNEAPQTDTIKINNRNVNDHKIGYKTTEPETYLAFFKQKNIANQWMVSVVYCKFDYGWKLVNMEISPYTQNGKTAMELYDFAKECYAKGYIVDAVNAMAGSRICMAPSRSWEYPNQTAMDAFYASVLDKANEQYKYPLVISQIPTHPRIFRVFTQRSTEGVFPMIFYASRVKLSDVAGIKKENEAVRKVIGNIMPGINKNKKYVFYSVFNKRPNSYESVDRYEVTDTLK